MGGLLGNLGRLREDKRCWKALGEIHVQALHDTSDPAQMAMAGPLWSLRDLTRKRCWVHGRKDRCWLKKWRNVG